MSAALCSIRRAVAYCTRSLATAATSSSSSDSASRSKFSQKLETGPSLDDFIAGDGPDVRGRIVLGNTKAPRLPSFLKTSIPAGGSYAKIKKDLRGLKLHTVCEEARCPNIGDCWGGGSAATDAEARSKATATIMVYPLT